MKKGFKFLSIFLCIFLAAGSFAGCSAKDNTEDDGTVQDGGNAQDGTEDGDVQDDGTASEGTDGTAPEGEDVPDDGADTQAERILQDITKITFENDTASELLLTNGRTYYANNEMKLFWSSTGFTFSFNGTGASITATANSDRFEPQNSFLNVYVDGDLVPTKTIQFTALEAAEYVLAENLPAGDHTIRIAKRNQPTLYDQINIGIVEINITGEGAGFYTVPAQYERQIEFLGDSVTAGQGNLLYDDRDNGDRKGAASEDTTMTYAALTAASFGAANQTLARSGLKFIRQDSTYIDYSILNELGLPRADGRDSITDYYTQTAAILSYEANTLEWEFERPSDVVVINLGTNDDGQYQYLLPGTDAAVWYKAEAEALIDLVREKNPDALIVWCFGMMGENPRTADPIKAAVNAKVAAGDTNLFYLSLAASDAIEGKGDGHPSSDAHLNRSYDLVRFIAEKTGWDYSLQPQIQTKLYCLDQINGIDEEALAGFTAESAEAYRTALSAAEALVGDASASYDQIRGATRSLQEAFRGLKRSFNYISRDGWTATAALNSGQAGMVFDGKDATDADRWTTGLEQNDGIKGTWFQVDRGTDTSTFDGIHLSFGPSGDYPRGSIVFFSDNPEEDWAGDDYTQWKGQAATGGTNLVDVYDLPGSTARYIRIVYTAEATAAWWSIYEFNLFVN